MTIGKRKGVAAKGAGAAPDQGGINNRTGGSLSRNDHNYLTRTFGLTFDPGAAAVPSGSSGDPLGHSATGGKISDWVDPSPGKVYRSHIFTSSGFFNLTQLSPSYPAACEYLVVAGGGGGGYEGGGGAGGLRTNLAGHPRATPGNPAFPVSAQNYIITVGAGGAGRKASTSGPGDNDGSISKIETAPGSTVIVQSTGGGGAGWHPSWNGRNGGSGGGSASNPMTAGTGSAPPTYTEGYPGGQGPNPAGGGGGAGGAGVSDTGPPTSGGHGGIGVQVLIAGNATNGGAGAPGPGGPGTEMGWFAGGGGGAPGAQVPTGNQLGPQGGGGPTGTHGDTPFAGGGAGRYGVDAVNPLLPNGAPQGAKRAGFSGASGTGGGGGGVWSNSGNPYTGHGGSGTVIIRYQIGTVAPGNVGEGGAVSFWSNANGSPSPTGSWIHIFTNSGKFTAPSEFSAPITWALVGGGGGGGGSHPTQNYAGGGGGAGGYRTGTTGSLNGPFTSTVTIGGGGINGSKTPGSAGETAGTNGWNTTLVLPAPAGGTITGFGGGGGGGGGPGASSSWGGSGGGGGWGSSAVGNQGVNPNSPAPMMSDFGLPHPYAHTQGNTGGNVGPSNTGAYAGGGGGAGAVGMQGQTEGGGGGIGVQLPTAFRNPALQSPPTSTGGLGSPGAGVPTTPGFFWVGGGGGGGRPGENPAQNAWNAGGGGQVEMNPPSDWNHGIQSTGGGGSGVWGSSEVAGQGGSGLVVITYPA